MKKRCLGIVILLVALNILFYSYRYAIFSENVKRFDDHMKNKFISEYRIIIKDFSNLSNFIFDAYMNINSLSFSYFYNDSYFRRDSDLLRGKLYNHISPIFEKSKDIGFSQIHFHTADGYSYLRMHRPEQYGDKLYDIRPMIKSVMETQKKVEGFEVGVNEVAYRTIYPLRYGANYIGSVEIAISSDYLINYMNRELSSYYYMIIDKKVAHNMREDAIKKRYINDNTGNFYIIRGIVESQKERWDAVSKAAQFASLLVDKNKDFVVHLKNINLIAVAIKDYSGRFIGYLVKEDENDYFLTQKFRLIMETSGMAIFTTIIMIALVLIFRKNEQLKNEIYKGNRINSELEQVNKLFNLVVENSGQIFYDYNFETGHVRRFGAIESILGIPKEKFSETSIVDFVSKLHKDDRESTMKFITDKYEEGKRFSCNYRLRNENNEYVNIFDQGLHLSINNERHIVGTMKDITSIVMYEQAIQQNQRLESMALLAGGIAHDFNNLLAGMWTYIEMIRLTDDPKMIDECLNKANSAFLRAKALISQLLTFTRSGDPEMKPINIKMLVKNIAEFANAGSSVKLHFDIQDNTKNCIGDEYQISQVIENLIINARHATSDKGDIYIKICNHEVPQSLDKQQNELLKPGIYVKITIEDNGVGIPAENINKIFEPFYTTKSKGKGIGLAISHNIIKKHNGVIRVESEAGKFTRFDIYLPATDDKEEKQIEKRYEKEGSLLTIALMDDEFFILDSSKLLLETLGHNVLTASRGEELIEIYRDYIKNGKDIDIFILDVTIVGGMGGIETIKELKKINPDVKAIVSSGYSDDPVFTKYREYGFAATLKKPYNIAEMSEAIKVALENG